MSKEREGGFKVAAIGTHGTGKTTLIKRIGELTELPVIHERARSVARDWGYTPATVPEERALEYQLEVIMQQVGAETAYHKCGFVSDRSVIDNLAYLSSRLPEGATPFNNGTYRQHFSYANMRMEHYDMLLYIPVMFPLPDDGERHTDLGYQKVIDETVRKLVRDFNLSEKLYVLRSEGVENRIEEVTDAIARRRKHLGC